MMPVARGPQSTRLQIGLYTIPMAVAAIAPWALGLAHALYGVVALVASGVFLWLATVVAMRTPAAGDAMKPEKKLFGFSILYLFLLFGALVVDRWVLA